MKKPLLFSICLGLIGSCAGPVARAAPDDRSRNPKAIVHSLEIRYHSATTLKATFLERYSEGHHDLRMESGTAYFRRPGRMRWEYESPEQKLFLADGKTVWFYVPADHTVSRAPMKESTDWRTPLALLTGKARLSRLCGRIELVSPAPGAAGTPSGHVLLRCLPPGEPAVRAGSRSDALAAGERSAAFQEVLLEVEESRSELIRVLIRQATGVEIEYRFGNWQQNLTLPEALFHFQAPRGVAIVDDASIGGPGR